MNISGRFWWILGASLGFVGQQSYGQTVGPRREIHMVDEITIDDGGDDLGSEKEPSEGDMASGLDEQPALPLTARRARFGRGLSLSLGSTRPWQRASLSLYTALDEWSTVGVFAGTGGWTRDGNLGLKFYDMAVSTKSFGVNGQRWFQDAEHFCLEGTLGYVAWDGKLTPRGQVEGEDLSGDALSTGIAGTGLFAGVSFLLGWIWDNGITFDWTILGVQKTYVLKLDQSRVSPAAGTAARSGLTTPEFFGLTGIAIGYRF